MAWTTVRSIRVCTTGTVSPGPCRVRGIFTITSTTKGAVSVHDGATGTLVYDTLTSMAEMQLLPDAGVWFQASCSVTAPAGTIMTFYYD